MTFDGACALMTSALAGPFRRQVVDLAATATNRRSALTRIRDQMRSHRWIGGVSTRVALDPIVRHYDVRTHQDGLHVLNDWDGRADHVNVDTIPVDVAGYLIDKSGHEPPDPRTLAILVDYYFVYLLALLVVQACDGDVEANFARLDDLVAALQGPEGSGERFIESTETLLLIAGSHYERHEEPYYRLLARVRELPVARRRKVALSHAASLGSHLRFGLETTYNKDIGAMRDDNVADYPWLSFALGTLVEEWVDTPAASPHRTRLAEAIANGLSADAEAFLGGHTPAVLTACDAERRTVRDWFGASPAAHLAAFEPFRPAAEAFCPLAFFFNFSQNVLKGAVVDATLWGEPRGLSLDAILTGCPAEADANRKKLQLVATLMAFARQSPDRIRGQLTPVIVYDVVAGRRAFGTLRRAATAAFGLAANRGPSA